MTPSSPTGMKPSEAMRLLDDYEKGLKEYTYLSFP